LVLVGLLTAAKAIIPYFQLLHHLVVAEAVTLLIKLAHQVDLVVVPVIKTLQAPLELQIKVWLVAQTTTQTVLVAVVEVLLLLVSLTM
jgi:hypothetical protein